MISSFPHKLYAYAMTARHEEMIGNIDEAIHCYKKLILLKPALEYYEKLAENLGKLGKNSQALIYLNEMVTVSAFKLEAHEIKANCLFQMKMFREALSSYDQILLLQTSSEKTKFALMFKIDCLVSLERHQEALYCIEGSWSLARNPYICNQKGRCLKALNRETNASTCFTQALHLNSSPRKYFEFYVKGYSLLNLGRVNEALDCFNKALESNPTHELSIAVKATIQPLPTAPIAPSTTIPNTPQAHPGVSIRHWLEEKLSSFSGL